ncbi:hypothetical protein [Sorangium sp. So ce854]|uniref:hypothetical protein n=1 Tax=Sorangium sp. So ce854 TaxID=3133322 RepID=UPI003F5E7A1C
MPNNRYQERLDELQRQVEALEQQNGQDASSEQRMYLDYARDRLARAKQAGATSEHHGVTAADAKAGDPWYRGHVTCDPLAGYGYLDGEPFFGGVQLVQDPRNHPCTVWEISVSRLRRKRSDPWTWVEDWQGNPFGLVEIIEVQHRIKVLNGIGALRWLHGIPSHGGVSLAIDQRMEGAQWWITKTTDRSGYWGYAIHSGNEPTSARRTLSPDATHTDAVLGYEDQLWWFVS